MNDLYIALTSEARQIVDRYGHALHMESLEDIEYRLGVQVSIGNTKVIEDQIGYDLRQLLIKDRHCFLEYQENQKRYEYSLLYDPLQDTMVWWVDLTEEFREFLEDKLQDALPKFNRVEIIGGQPVAIDHEGNMALSGGVVVELRDEVPESKTYRMNMTLHNALQHFIDQQRNPIRICFRSKY